MSDCLFCRLIGGEIPATIVRETAQTVAFRDIAPQAPVHVLVVPRAHHGDLAALTVADPELAVVLLRAAHEVAEQEGLGGEGAGYRVVFNTGPDAGQTVHHVHAHVLGGRPLGHFG